MDFKDIVLQNENALPTLADNLSTTTAQVSLPTVTASSSTFWKFGVSTVVGLLGMLYLGMGKKQNDVGKMILGAVLTLASFFMFGCARRGPKPPAPEVSIPTLLQAPRSSLPALKDFRGQVVVLEFWATWCGPCLELLPHMNKLVAEFQGKPVHFISVTDEDRATVEAFMAKHPMKAWIGLDPGGAVGRAFGVWTLPHAFVIDPYGRIWLEITPSFLYASDITDALNASPPAPQAGS